MAHISIRVPENEKNEIEKYAKFCGESVSTLIRKLFREKMEDFEDIQVIKEYEKKKKNNELVTYSHEDVWGELNIE